MVSMTIPFEYYFMCMTLHDLWNQNKPQPECPVQPEQPVDPGPVQPIMMRPCNCTVATDPRFCDPAECGVDDLCGLPYHKNYVAYHLNGQSVNIDGVLDDQAWAEVPWSSKFVDIKGSNFPPPRFDTQFKLRWDDGRLYIAGLIKETDLWATFTVDDKYVYLDNSFGLFYSPDGSLQNYKQIDINALGTHWDLALRRGYIDGGSSEDLSWSSGVVKAVSSDGPVNDVSTKATYWSVEMAIPFSKLAEKSTRSITHPEDDEVLFMQFARPQYQFKIVNGKYVKKDIPAQWWSWQPHGVVNLHIPSKWGLVQFRRTMTNKGFGWSRWHVYRALFDIHEAMHTYKALYRAFPDDIRLLKLPAYLTTENCVYTPSIQVRKYGSDFVASVRSKFLHEVNGNIRADRYVWFGQNE